MAFLHNAMLSAVRKIQSSAHVTWIELKSITFTKEVRKQTTKKYCLVQLIEKPRTGLTWKQVDGGLGLPGDGDLAKGHERYFGGDGNLYMLG